MRTLWFGLLTYMALVALHTSEILGSIEIYEALTWFVTNATFGEVFERARNFQGQSPLFFLPYWIMQQVLPLSPLLLRLPSLVGALTIFLFISSPRFINETKHRWIIIVLLASLLFSEEHKIFISARPYIFSLLITFLLLRGVIYKSTVGFSVNLLLVTIGAHVSLFNILLFPLLLPQLFKESRLGWRRCLRSAILIILCMSTLYPVVSGVVSNIESWSYLRRPTFMDVLFAPYSVCFWVALILVVVARGHRRNLEGTALRMWLLGFGFYWYVVIVNSVASHMLAASVFSAKYLSLSWAGLLFGMTAIAGSFEDSAKRGLLVVLLSGLVIFEGYSRAYQKPVWGNLAHSLLNIDDPIIVDAGLVEQQDRRYFESQHSREYLVSPLRFYLKDQILHPYPRLANNLVEILSWISTGGSFDLKGENSCPLGDVLYMVVENSALIRIKNAAWHGPSAEIETRDVLGNFTVLRIEGVC